MRAFVPSAVRLCLFCLLVQGSILAPASGEIPRVLPARQVPHDKRLEPLIDAYGYFPFTPPATREAWAQRAAELRRQVLVAAGLWPMPEPAPGSPVIHGKVDREGYTVEKVFFESYPGYFVTGNLYRPKNGAGKRPAVLCPHGHWTEGRFLDSGPAEVRKQIVAGAERFEVGGRYPLQARCVQLARMGCVVFHYDMVGYADSRQLDHRPGVRAEMNDPRHWGFFSPQAEARLQTIFGLQTYNSVRALDFVCGLPDVDAARIGVTGASGGGTQTFILGAIDPARPPSFPPSWSRRRCKAAAPARTLRTCGSERATSSWRGFSRLGHWACRPPTTGPRRSPPRACRNSSSYIVCSVPKTA